MMIGYIILAAIVIWMFAVSAAIIITVLRPDPEPFITDLKVLDETVEALLTDMGKLEDRCTKLEYQLRMNTEGYTIELSTVNLNRNIEN